jgi:hypothetical protein
VAGGKQAATGIAEWLERNSGDKRIVRHSVEPAGEFNG